MAALDGLHASVLAVIAFHAGALPGGWLGVEVFFVLSGYLITTIMIGEVDRTNTVGLKAFWGRRVRRLWPAISAYLLVTLVIIVPRFVAVTPPTTRHLVATLTWRQNWQMIGDGGYGAGLHAGVVEHFWSLSIEEQFYFVWPVLVWAVVRWVGKHGVRAVAAAGALTSLAFVVWGLSHGWSVDRVYLGSDTRVLGLCVGALFAGVRPTGRVAASVAGAGVTAIIACCWWFGDIRHGILAGPLQLFTAVSVLTIVCSAGLRRGPLVWKPIRAIGRWSFGIYLWHLPIGMIVRSHVANVWWEALWTAAIATAVAAASYKVIELPVRRRLPRGRAIALALTAAAVTCVAIGVVEVQQEQHPVAALNPDVTAPPDGSSPVPADAPKVVIFGDSVPFQAAGELAAAGRDAGFATTVHAADGCIPTTEPSDQFWEPCRDWVAGLPQAVAGADIVVMWWGNTGSEVQWHGALHTTCDSPEAVSGALDEVVQSLHLSATTRLVVVLPSERADQGVRDHQGTVCQRAATTEWADAHGYLVFDPDPTRLATGSEREVRRDGLHYTARGAQAVGDALFGLLARVPVRWKAMTAVPLFELEASGPDTYIGYGPQYPWGGLFGGQIVAQALRAAAYTVDANLPVHSLRAYFIRRGDHNEPIRFEVDRIRDGRSFVTRRVVAYQAVGAILNLEASFHQWEDTEDIQRHQLDPSLPRPDELASEQWTDAFDRCSVQTLPEGRLPVWMKVNGTLPDEQLLHRCWLAYMSDDIPIDSMRHGHPVFHGPDGHKLTMSASLDHTIWFHRPLKADEWHLYDVQPESYQGARGLAIGRVFSMDGVHVATFAQEGLVRRARAARLTAMSQSLSPTPEAHAVLADQINAVARLTGTFTLRSGQIATEYFDKYRFEAVPTLLAEIAVALAPLVPADTEVLAGLEMGGIPIATALSMHTGLPAAFVRKEAKKYGTARLAEGADIVGKRVCVVEDVITTGGQVVISTQDLRALGALVDHVVCVIDRSPDAGAALTAAGLQMHALLTRAQLDAAEARRA